MELKRVLAKDSRTALEEINEKYGENAVIVESNKIQGKIEMIVAIDIETDCKSKASGKSPVENILPHPTEDFELALKKSIEEPNLTGKEINKTALEANEHEKLVGLIEREQLRARELVDLIKKEIAGIKEELRIERELELWNSKPSLNKEFHVFNPIFDELSMPAGLSSLLIKIINEASNRKEAAHAIREFLLSCVPAEKVLEFRGIHAVAGNPGSGKTSIISDLSQKALKKVSNSDIAIISFDDLRLGAWSHFQLMGAKLGIDTFKASNSETLKLILQDLSERKLIFIDMPGIKSVENLDKLKNINQSINFHLAIPCDSSANALEPLIKSKSIKWSSMVVTRLDCHGAPWQLLELFNKYKLSCSYISKNEQTKIKLIKYTKDMLLKMKFDKFLDIFDKSSIIEKNKAERPSIKPNSINNIKMHKSVKNTQINEKQMIAPEEIMTDPLLAISKLVEKKHNLAKNL